MLTHVFELVLAHEAQRRNDARNNSMRVVHAQWHMLMKSLIVCKERDQPRWRILQMK